jgi:outer membrane protein assembly factor BamB
LSAIVVCFALGVTALPGAKTPAVRSLASEDMPMFGGTPSRNMVSPAARNLPVEWAVEEGKQKNIKWAAAIGTRGYGTPVIAGGRVFVSTNNKAPRDPKVAGPKAVIMCFREKDGGFLWQTAFDMAPVEVDQQAVEDGMCSTPVVEGDKLYFVTPGCQVVCARADDGKTIWLYDMMKELKVYPCIINSCSPLLVGDRLFVMTGNGIGEEGEVKVPQASSFIALDKKTGALQWQSSLPGKNICNGQWANATFAEMKGEGQVIFPGGDGWLYSLAPDTGKLLWKFECNPMTGADKEERVKRNNLVATPVFDAGKVYVGIGRPPESGFGGRVGHFWCVDVDKRGDVSAPGNNFDSKAPPNAKSALVWHFGGNIEPKPSTGRSVILGPTISTCSVCDGLVYVGEEAGYLYCLDARTGQKYWEHDLKAPLWGSPYCADGKIYQGAEDGVVYVFRQGKQKELLHENDMGEGIYSTPAVAHGVLYVTTKSKLYAISNAK